MTTEIILFSLFWPTQKAITYCLEKNSIKITHIYQNENKLLELLCKKSDTPLILDIEPHRNVLLMSAISIINPSRPVITLSRCVRFNDNVVSNYFFGVDCRCYSDFFSLGKFELYQLLKSDGKNVPSLPYISRPKLMSLYSERRAIYELLQSKIYQDLYMLGATSNEVTTLRLLLSGMHIEDVADIQKLQVKTIYTYRSQIAHKTEGKTTTRELLRSLRISEKNQDNEYFSYTFENECSSDDFTCEKCSMFNFCFKDVVPDKVNHFNKKCDNG